MIEINNLTSEKIDEKFLKRVAKIVLKGENREKENISIAFVGSGTIKSLNKKYRKKNKATDVLSFGSINDLGLTEVVICPKVAKNEGMEKVVIHGILHILGYDHEKSVKEAKKMEKKEEEYLVRIFDK